MSIRFFHHKSFYRSLNELSQKGGRPQRIADTVLSIFGKKSIGVTDPFETHRLTKHGEPRIKNCVKYDLQDGYRLITVKQNNCCIFLYVGNHAECEHWLDEKRGKQFTINNKNELQEIFEGSELINTEYSPGPDRTLCRLLERLEKVYLEIMRGASRFKGETAL